MAKPHSLESADPGGRAARSTVSPRRRRVLQAVLYEVVAVAMVGPAIGLLFDRPAPSAFGLALLMSSVALVWNVVFNALFERWEKRQAVKGRSLLRRLVHGGGFEGGLTVLLVPPTAWWLGISMLESLLTNVGLLGFFFVYAIAFTWAFDRVFGLPASARQS